MMFKFRLQEIELQVVVAGPGRRGRAVRVGPTRKRSVASERLRLSASVCHFGAAA